MAGMLPYTVLKSIQANFHQGDENFGNTEGSQCAINSLVALCFSTVKIISTWNNVHLNFVLEKGDSIYKNLGFTGNLSFDDLPQSIDLAGSKFKYYQVIPQLEITK